MQTSLAQSVKRKAQKHNLKRKAKPFFFNFKLYALRFTLKKYFEICPVPRRVL